MATAVEYTLIAGCVGIAITAGVWLLPNSSASWDGDADIKQAVKACAARPASNTNNVVFKSWLGYEVEYKCSTMPRIFYPTFVRFHR